MTAPLRFGLLGWPVKHSVSPQMQGAGFAALGLAATYELLPVEPEHVAAKVAELKAAGFAGWNITVPHKGAMRRLVDTAEPAAAAADSVNTVVHRDGRLHGYSTDGYGLEMATREAFGCPVRGGRFVFWGTGGAARATAVHFVLEGAREVVLVNRTLDKAVELAALLQRLGRTCQVATYAPEPTPALAAALRAADVIYQCTSVGLKPDDPCAIPLALLQPGARVMDMIYHPTRLLAEAKAHGCLVADGQDMLLYQGARSFHIWTGQEAPIPAMRQGLRQALGH